MLFKTILSSSSMDKDLKDTLKKVDSKINVSKIVGESLGSKFKKANIDKIIFKRRQLATILGYSSYADYIIIATCRSSKHVNATSQELHKKFKKNGILCNPPEGKPQCDWTIVDSNVVVVHLFSKEIRMHYNIEKLWEMSFDSLNNKII